MVKIILFFYGTLKTGEPNYHLLTEKKTGLCRLVGRARTLEKYPLVITSPYNIPFLLYKAGTGQNVEGELYEVDDEQLGLVDDLEKHPHWYERREIRVEIMNEMPDHSKTNDDELELPRESTSRTNERKGASLMVQTYFLVKYQPCLLVEPTYSSYYSGIDGKKFKMPPNDVTEDSMAWLAGIHTEHEQLITLMNFGDHLKA